MTIRYNNKESKELIQKIKDKLEREWCKHMEICKYIRKEIDTIKHIENNSKLEVTTNDEIVYEWNCDIIKSKIPVWVFE